MEEVSTTPREMPLFFLVIVLEIWFDRCREGSVQGTILAPLHIYAETLKPMFYMPMRGWAQVSVLVRRPQSFVRIAF